LIEANTSEELRKQNSQMRKFSENLLKDIVEINTLREENVKLKVSNHELNQQLLETKAATTSPKATANNNVEVIDVG